VNTTSERYVGDSCNIYTTDYASQSLEMHAAWQGVMKISTLCVGVCEMSDCEYARIGERIANDKYDTSVWKASCAHAMCSHQHPSLSSILYRALIKLSKPNYLLPFLSTPSHHLNSLLILT
jgi:hypothetical protein